MLAALEGVAGIEWIRLMYFYPMYIDDELIDRIAASSKILPYLDMPLQHISDRLLRRMARRVTRAECESLLERLRKRIPGLTMRTTFITGFPGETEADFEELEAFVRSAAVRAGGRVYLFARARNAGRSPGRSFARSVERGAPRTAHDDPTGDFPGA